MKAQPCIYYFVHDAKILSDGVLRVRTGGTDGECLFDGVHDVSPDSPDYEFWLWLKGRQKRRWFRSVPALDEQAIAKYREEYSRERA